MTASQTLVVAEPGSTHEGQLMRMLQLIDIAAEAGADVVKFQWVSCAERLVRRRHAEGYLDSYRLLQFPRRWLEGLRYACESVGVEFACTVYLPEDVDAIKDFVPFFKVSSFESGDYELRAVLETHKKPILASTGARDGIEVALLQVNAPSQADYRWLHCISAYPTPPNEMQLHLLREPMYDGLSDHSRNIRTGGYAVCAGASIIETHFAHPKTSPACKDAPVSFTGRELQLYIDNIREAEVLLYGGKGAQVSGRVVSPSEKAMTQYQVSSRPVSSPHVDAKKG